MNIAIIGAGNIGSLLGALLVESGQDVTLVELRDEVVTAIRNEGIRLDLSDGRKYQVKVNVTKDIKSIGTPDLIILAVKSYSTTAAAKDAKSIAGKDTWIMSVQNGAGNVEAITAALGGDDRIIGSIFLCVLPPLSINHLSWVVGTDGLKIGPANGVMSPMIEQVAETFRKTGIDVVTSPAVQDLIWSKVLQNVHLGLATTGVPQSIANWVSGLSVSNAALMAIIILIYILLGTFLDILSIVILTTPIFYPIITNIGFNPITFGVVIVILMMIGSLSPPFGINVYAMKGAVKDVPLFSIFKGTMPLPITFVVLLLIVLVFPQLTLFLPSVMIGQ